MNSTQLFRLVESGVTVTIEKSNGIVERFSPLKDGRMTVTYKGPNTCMYCGRFAPKGCCSKCNQEIETLSLTGAYRHINSINTRFGVSLYDPKSNALSLSERSASCAL